MEFPHIGKHCSESSCHRLDFLPVKCDSCNKVFCSSHYNYENHSCTGPRLKDMQVPVCPLCSEPVPTAPGVEPDLTVGRHIDQQCKSETKKIFTNRCSFKNCKRKELIPVTCTQCHRNYCLRHRHTSDHNCKEAVCSGKELDQRALAAQAADYRRVHKPTSLFRTQPTPVAAHVQTVQGNMSEDEALARALALSILELDESSDRNRRRREAAAAAALQANATTVRVGGRDGQSANTKDKCMLS